MPPMTRHSAYKSLPLEHGRAADDTTYGIQSLADVNVVLHEDRERSGRAADNTTNREHEKTHRPKRLPDTTSYVCTVSVVTTIARDNAHVIYRQNAIT